MAENGARAGSRVRLIGRFELRAGGERLDARTLGSAQARCLVGLLVLDDAPTRTAPDVAAALWGGCPPASWRESVRGLVLRVRDATAPLGGARLDTTPEGYQLRLPRPLVVDVTEVDRLAARAERALAEGRVEDAHEDADRAVTESTGDLLPGADGPWVRERRDALRRTRLGALSVLAGVHLATGDAAVAVDLAEQALALDPTSERACRVAVEAHVARGESGAAAAAFERCRRVLAERHGVAPSPQTVALFDRLVSPA